MKKEPLQPDNAVIDFFFFFFFFFLKKILRNGIFKMETKKKDVVPAMLASCTHFHEAVWHWAGNASADDWHITLREALPQTSLTCVLL